MALFGASDVALKTGFNSPVPRAPLGAPDIKEGVPKTRLVNPDPHQCMRGA